MELRPFSGTYLTDPAAIWRDLLDGPERVHYADDLGLWLITKHADVRTALGDSEAFSNALTLMPIYDMCPEALSIVMQIDAPPTTAAADAPTHTRTRRALRATFANTAARVNEQYGAMVRRRVDELVSRLVARRGTVVDLVSDFAAELPLLVIVDLLGAPPEDVPAIKSWSDGQIALVWGQPDPAEQVRLAQGLLDFWRYCQRLVAIRVREGHDGDDFISKALRYRGGDDEILTEDEVASLAFNLLVAGHETTSGLIAHSLDNALSVSSRWERLVENPAGVPAFIEETLRFGPAIDGWLRVTTRDVAIGETTIPAGSRCLLLLGAANRDSGVFAHPDVFDPHRADGRDHLSFGYGPHFCIGAALARLEAQVALTQLTAAVPGLRLAPEHVSSFKPNAGFRAHHALPVFVETFARVDERAPRAA
ncbi:cytochrome P450 [Phytohabitans kaempferiae]|uniref:Cytochrome P450 n=1 Tax=Phytohabitans kaempferiae TaxID=1620943 RepID=A0ABV6MC87_9ACTN